MPSTFDLLVVPGVTVDKWSRVWAQRQTARLRLVPAEAADAAGLLLSAQADAGLVRLPVDQDALHAIPLYTETTVVVIPRDAVQVNQKGSAVFVVKDGKAHRQDVVTGLQTDTQVEVLNGLDLGTEIVLAGHNGLKDQALVRVVPTKE